MNIAHTTGAPAQSIDFKGILASGALAGSIAGTPQKREAVPISEQDKAFILREHKKGRGHYSIGGCIHQKYINPKTGEPYTSAHMATIVKRVVSES